MTFGTFSVLLAICQGNRPVTSGFPTHMSSHAGRWYMPNCWPHNWVAVYLRHLNAHITCTFFHKDNLVIMVYIQIQKYFIASCLTISSVHNNSSDTIHHQHLIQLEFTIVTSYPENTEWVHCIWVYNLKVNNRSKGGKKLTWVYGPLIWNTSDSLFLLNQGVHWLEQEKNNNNKINK